jgi:hypothetical protein
MITGLAMWVDGGNRAGLAVWEKSMILAAISALQKGRLLCRTSLVGKKCLPHASHLEIIICADAPPEWEGFDKMGFEGTLT